MALSPVSVSMIRPQSHDRKTIFPTRLTPGSMNLCQANGTPNDFVSPTCSMKYNTAAGTQRVLTISRGRVKGDGLLVIRKMVFRNSVMVMVTNYSGRVIVFFGFSSGGNM